jgi:hypothetical protein
MDLLPSKAKGKAVSLVPNTFYILGYSVLSSQCNRTFVLKRGNRAVQTDRAQAKEQALSLASLLGRA